MNFLEFFSNFNNNGVSVDNLNNFACKFSILKKKKNN